MTEPVDSSIGREVKHGVQRSIQCIVLIGAVEIGAEIECVADLNSMFHQIGADGFRITPADAHENHADIQQGRGDLDFFDQTDFIGCFGGIGFQPGLGGEDLPDLLDIGFGIYRS